MSNAKLPQSKEKQPAKAKTVWSQDKAALLRKAAKLRSNGDCNCACK